MYLVDAIWPGLPDSPVAAPCVLRIVLRDVIFQYAPARRQLTSRAVDLSRRPRHQAQLKGTNNVSDSVTSASALLLPRLQADQAAARRAQDKSLVLLLGMLISEVKNRELELRRGINDDDAVEVVRKAIKRRKEAVTVYEKAGRGDLAAKEQAEANALEQYLPPQVDPAELRAAVIAAVASGAANVGAVMAKVMPQFKGRVDGSSINALAREVLAGSK